MAGLDVAFLAGTLVCAGSLAALVVAVLRSRPPSGARAGRGRAAVRRLAVLLSFALASVVAYGVFLLCRSRDAAMVAYTLHQCLAAAVVNAGLVFALAHTGLGGERVKFLFRDLLLILLSADVSSLLINLRTLHSFDLTLRHFGRLHPYWDPEFLPFHTVHFALCGSLALAAVAVLAAAAIRSPSFCKARFVVPLSATLAVAAASALSLSADLPVDLSVPLFALSSWAVCKASVFSRSASLVTFMLEQANELVDDGLIFFTADGKFGYANHVARNLMGGGDHLPPVVAERYFSVWRTMYCEGRFNVRDAVLVDGIERHFRVEYKNLDAGDVRLGSYFMFVDRTRETMRLLSDRHSATHDELTGLYNRRGFLDAVAEARREEEGPHLMLASNIKDFKLVNDVFGPSMGDMMLKRLANFVKFYAHADTIAARMGDDKFAMYLRKSNFSRELFMDCFSKLGRLVEESPYSFHVFVGIYEPAEGSDESPELMFDKANLAITRISDDFQSVFSEYDGALMETLLAERAITDEFDSALALGQFRLFLQPQVRPDGSLHGAEALVRWDHPTRGLLEPREFLGVLEKTGLMWRLDTFVWGEAARLAAKWRRLGVQCRVGVNVSPRDGYYTDIAATLAEIASRNGISPVSLGVEVGEEVLMADFDTSRRLLDDLRSRGFSVAIDAFGAGYSSLNMLKDISADVLKIDREFLQEPTAGTEPAAGPARFGDRRDILRRIGIRPGGLPDDGRNLEILRLVVDMACSLGMRVVVQGVETAEQLARVSDLGCTAMQGHHFSPPVPADEFERTWLKLGG